MNKNIKNLAFTLAEILIVMVIVALSLAVLIRIPKYEKTKSRAAIVPHGQFACAVTPEGKEVFIYRTESEKNSEGNVVFAKNLPLPPFSDARWKTVSGSCRDEFLKVVNAPTFPKTANVLNVLLFGAGAGGQAGSYEWTDDVYDDFANNNGDIIDIKIDENYRIEMHGQKGEETWLSDWKVVNTSTGGVESCRARPGYPGKNLKTSFVLELKQGDKLKFAKQNRSTVAAVSASTASSLSACRVLSGLYGSDAIFHQGGENGKIELSLIRNGVTALLGTITSPKAGKINCFVDADGNKYKCTLRFLPDTNIDSKNSVFAKNSAVSYLEGPINSFEQSALDGGVKVAINTGYAPRRFIPHAGCGGGSGRTGAIMYPFKTKVVPFANEFKIGRGGKGQPNKNTSGEKGGDTVFAQAMALGGDFQTRCNIADNVGLEGNSMPIVPILSDIGQTAGAGGTSSAPHAKNALGIGSGGGGGAVQYNKMNPPVTDGVGYTLGSGGNGAGGAIIISW